MARASLPILAGCAALILAGCAAGEATAPDPAAQAGQAGVTAQAGIAQAGEVAPGFPTAPARLLPLPAPGPPLRVYLDAGHGAPGNPGNTSCFGQPEQDFTRSLAEDIAPTLRAAGMIVTVSAPGSAYDDRIRAADQGDVLVSLHSDSRGEIYAWPLCPDPPCYWSLNDPGFALLWSDEAPPGSDLPDRRRLLAEAVAAQMDGAGFPASSGLDYLGMYERTAHGVFLDRHAPKKRIRMLRRPAVPSVIVETHHARYPGEAIRWDEPHTRDAFARALIRGLRAWQALEAGQATRSPAPPSPSGAAPAPTGSTPP